MGNASGAKHDVEIEEPRDPVGRRSDLLQKTRHCPLQEGPLRPERAKAQSSIRPAERPPTEKPPLPAVGGPSAVRPGEAAKFHSAGGAASYRKATITRCRRALCGPTRRSRKVPFGRRSGLLQKNHHYPLQEGPLRPERAKPQDSIRPAERPPTEKPPLPAVGGPSAARTGEGARFRSAGGAASYRKPGIARCRRALCGPNGRRRPIPFGRRSGLLQKNHHYPL
jgi:hypothetical protein